MFATKALVVPDMANANFEPDLGANEKLLSLSTTFTSGFKSIDKDPFAPFNVSVKPDILNSMSFGILTGSLAILDIIFSLFMSIYVMKQRK